ncbi:hypothetical protein TNCV_311851 [Trichonephila clavipes]|nr:hypothetical protein TNCV_311851 [Trichonephila clavipes]
MGQKTWQSDFVTRQCTVSHSKTSERHLEIIWTSVLPPLLYSQTWRHLTITSSLQGAHARRAAISKKSENGPTNGLPQKTSSFSGMVFINHLKDVPNV